MSKISKPNQVNFNYHIINKETFCTTNRMEYLLHLCHSITMSEIFRYSELDKLH